MSSACHRKSHQGRQYVNSGISKEIENPHDLNEHLNFCVKIDMQLAVSTRSHNTHQLVIGALMERKRKRERGGARNTDTSKACARLVKIRTTTRCSKRKQIIQQRKYNVFNKSISRRLEHMCLRFGRPNRTKKGGLKQILMNIPYTSIKTFDSETRPSHSIVKMRGAWCFQAQ